MTQITARLWVASPEPAKAAHRRISERAIDAVRSMANKIIEQIQRTNNDLAPSLIAKDAAHQAVRTWESKTVDAIQERGLTG